MPNTLAHIGVQTLVTRTAIRGADPSWIWLGCILPDLPWIGQRVLRALPLDLTVYDIRAYAVVQSSLLFCLVGAMAAACLAARPRQVFAIVAGGSLIHLVLDAFQTKWANGVILAAPFRWDLTNLGYFWPEHPLTLALTILGAVTALVAIVRMPPARSLASGTARIPAALLVAALWLAGPVAFLGPVKASDVHYLRTLAAAEARAGRLIEFDRASLRGEGGPVLDVWTGESLSLTGEIPDLAEGVISVKGRFVGPTEVHVESYHLHSGRWRDLMSYVGLAFIAAWWLWAAALRIPGRRQPRH